MKCTWDDTRDFRFKQEDQSVVKRMELRVFEAPQTGETPICICEYAEKDQWTPHEKMQAADRLAKALGYKDRQNIRNWQMEENGVIHELSFKALAYTTRSDRGDMPDAEFERDLKAGKVKLLQHTDVTIQQSLIAPEQQREELGQALLSKSQRRMFGPGFDD